VVSRPVLLPTQKVRIALPDANTMVSVTAHVAWATLEQASRERRHTIAQASSSLTQPKRFSRTTASIPSSSPLSPGARTRDRDGGSRNRGASSHGNWCARLGSR
jgi:hypothetical protein